MSSLRAILNVANTTALGLWLGTVVMTGATAALIFPTVRDLAPTLPSHATYTGEHWLIVAGRVAARVFLVSDIVQFTCACVALGTLAGLVVPRMIKSRLGLNEWVRVLTLGVACVLLAYQLLIMSPAMTTELQLYWAAASQGKNDVAMIHQTAFNTMHPQASRLIGALAFSVLAALIVSATIGTSGSRSLRGDEGDLTAASKG